HLFHQIQGLPGTEPRRSDTDNGGGRIEIVAGDQFGAQGMGGLHERGERDHLAQAVANVKVVEVLPMEPVGGVGLDIDLEHLVKFIEKIDIGRSQEGLQRGKYISQWDLQGLDLCPVNIQIDLWAAGAEGGVQVAQTGL